MRDGIYLMASAIALAAIGWVFWHFAGESGFEIISTVALVAVVADNIRLRRLLRSSRSN
ncbi:hypothetical protein [Aromatoleum petrolei]|uniref:Uncharacterized protein n=1 Tax=Aromatoleum petrolei TaxID=76116 RepID=A0ABX1MMP3_9RHOO|nr:hypothetical protein [Aromatoleum petrolei]NMF87309.1 hypothetical protein [Aromatoleum petrolei]QTQ38555.1 Uncharacterized protein ToN1_44570 [Aromatoleum petrolei]